MNPSSQEVTATRQAPRRTPRATKRIDVADPHAAEMAMARQMLKEDKRKPSTEDASAPVGISRSELLWYLRQLSEKQDRLYVLATNMQERVPKDDVSTGVVARWMVEQACDASVMYALCDRLGIQIEELGEDA